ncbi:hypothetical protein P4907_14240 [Escherichia coli]
MKGLTAMNRPGLPRWPKRSVFFMPIPDAMKGERSPSFPGGVVLRRIKGFGINDIPAQRQKGLLLIYLLDPQQALSAAEYQDDALPVVAFGISFPGSRSGVTVEYKVNNVLWEQEYGAAE